MTYMKMNLNLNPIWEDRKKNVRVTSDGIEDCFRNFAKENVGTELHSVPLASSKFQCKSYILKFQCGNPKLPWCNYSSARWQWQFTQSLSCCKFPTDVAPVLTSGLSAFGIRARNTQWVFSKQSVRILRERINNCFPIAVPAIST